MASVGLAYHFSTHQPAAVPHTMRSMPLTPPMKYRAAVLVIVLIVGARFIPFDVGRAFGIKGDEATYVAMALSLAYDGDLTYRAEDLHRFERLYGAGPEGVFLKQAYAWRIHRSADWPFLRIVKTPIDEGEALAFGKPFAHALVAAPFVRLAGLRGLLLLNFLLFGMVILMGWRFASVRIGSPAGALLAAAFGIASVAAVYMFWLTSEIFNFALVFAGYFLWLHPTRGTAEDGTARVLVWTDVAAAALLGLATYSKPPNALLICPLVLTLWSRRLWRRSLMVCAVFLLFSAGTFAVNALITGEVNYQGGNRRTFHGRFPFSDPSARFDRIGEQMMTVDSDAESLLAPHVMFPLLRHNLVYFFIGRHAGLVPYYFPGVVILALWLTKPRQWTGCQLWCASTLALSILIMLVLTPYSWNGGGGPPGNRYFLSLYPVLFFLLPDRRTHWLAVVSWVGVVVIAPLLQHPIAASKQPWNAVGHGLVRSLPIELTMVDDLPVRLGPRGRIPWGPDPKALVYFVDDATFSPEGDGFWVQGDASTDIIVRTERRLDRVDFVVRTVVANRVSLAMGTGHASLDLLPNQTSKLTMQVGSGLVYTHGSHAYVLSIKTTNGFVPKDSEAGSSDDRFLGVFVQPDFSRLEAARSGAAGDLNDSPRGGHHHRQRGTDERDSQGGLERQAQAGEIESKGRFADAEPVDRERQHLYDEADRHDQHQIHD